MQGQKSINSTKARLMNALVTLGATKNYLDIRITELCQVADVNRCTFYRYFDSKDVLLKELEDFLVYGFPNISNPPAHCSIGPAEKPLDYARRLTQATCEFVRYNREAFLFLLSPNGSPYFRNRLKKATKDFCVSIMAKAHIGSAPYTEYIAEYLTGGTIDMMQLWLVENNLPTEHIVHMLVAFYTASLPHP